MSQAGAEPNPRKGMPAGCAMNLLPGWSCVSLSKIQFFCLLLSASPWHVQTHSSPSLPRLPGLLPLSWLPDVQHHLCPGGAEFHITLHLWGRERNSRGLEQQGRVLHGAGGAAELRCSACCGCLCFPYTQDDFLLPLHAGSASSLFPEKH